MKDSKSTFLGEFKKFIMRGNVLDMAIGIVIGGAFTKIVQSLVQDIINPIIGLLIGKVDFTGLKVVLVPATAEASEVAIRYGMLIQYIVQFLLTALVLFLIVRSFNRVKEKIDEDKKVEKENEAEKAIVKEDLKETKADENTLLLREIRDLLKK